ncbi:MAG: hypothetical protein ACYDBJ_24945 [Aggregatilineales bacterium]
MHIAILPADTPDAASSRIRAYTLHEALNSLGSVQATRGYSDTADVLYVQKKLTPRVLDTVKRAKSRGLVILYDVDDTGTALGNWAPAESLARMVELADVVTTDTAGHRDQLLGQGISRVEIVPDAIDYFPQAPVRLQQADASPLRVLWFGNLSNIGLFERYLDVLQTIADVQPVVATGSYGAYGLAGSAKHYALRYPSVEFVPWSRLTFIQTVQKCHLSCLMHDGSDLDRAKSNNKFITSVTWGVPAIVSDTPEYARTAREAGVEYAIFADPDHLAEAIERLRYAQARAAYLAAAQPIIWEQYAPQVVARLFLEVVAACKGKSLADRLSADSSPALPPVQNNSSQMQSLNHSMRRFAKKYLPYPVKRTLAPYVPAIRRSLLLDPARTASVQRDYKRTWVSQEGRAYRMSAYERQRAGGLKPLDANPTLDEIRAALRIHAPQSVLEVGCRRGRLLDGLKDEFNIEGCDVSPDMLKQCPPGLPVFEFDVATEQWQFVHDNAGRWDVIFVRGVMLYLIENPLQTAYAMNNMLMLASKKILIWEWPEVCAQMQDFSDSLKFEYHPIEHRNE